MNPLTVRDVVIGEGSPKICVPIVAHTAKELEELRAGGKKKIQIHGGGMGCAFIKTDIFSRLSFPYYDWVNYPDRGILSEDLFFCEQCKERGIPIYTDTRVGCGHIFRRTQWV